MKRCQALFPVIVLAVTSLACKARSNQARLANLEDASAGVAGGPGLAPDAASFAVQGAEDRETGPALERLADELAAIATAGPALGLALTEGEDAPGNLPQQMQRLRDLLASEEAKLEAMRERGDDSTERANAEKLVRELKEKLAGSATQQPQTPPPAQQPPAQQQPQPKPQTTPTIVAQAQQAGATKMPLGKACEVNVWVSKPDALLTGLSGTYETNERALELVGLADAQQIWVAVQPNALNVGAGAGAALTGDTVAKARHLYVQWPATCETDFAPSESGARVIGTHRGPANRIAIMSRLPLAGNTLALVRVPQPPKPELERVDETTIKYLGQTIACERRAGLDPENGSMVYQLKIDGTWLDHQNGGKEAMSLRHCKEVLKTVKNGFICATMGSEYRFLSFTAPYRVKDRRGLGGSYYFPGSWFEECAVAINRSTAKQICTLNFIEGTGGGYRAARFDHVTDTQLQTYGSKGDVGWNECLADLK